MAKVSLVREVMASYGGIAKTADFVCSGIEKWDVKQLSDDGVIERVRHGYYKMSDDYNVTDELVLHKVLPEGIVCMESALFHYGYSDFCPRVWSIAVPRTISRQKLKLDSIDIKAYFVLDNILELGKTMDHFAGVQLAVYDRERTICDCFKYRNKIDSEIFNKAIHAYVKDDKKNLHNLYQYARKMRVYKKLSALLEVMLSG